MAPVIESHTDVLTIGTGPSCLAAAYWMARYGVNARIVNKRATKHRVLHDGVEITDFCFWEILDSAPYRMHELSQGRIERYILDVIKDSSSLVVERWVAAEALEYDTSLEGNHDEYPNHSPAEDTLRRRANCCLDLCWTKKQLDISLLPVYFRGVLDVVPITDFQVDASPRRLDRSSITLNTMREKMQQMLKPFQFDFKVCDWWTTYQIGQRIAQNFTKGRIYLAGDAVHNHSPKVGMAKFEAMKEVLNSVEPFAEGLLSHYGNSLLVHKNGQQIAKNLSPGERLIPAKGRNQAGGMCRWTTGVLQSDGRFRILLLAGDTRMEEQKRRVLAFGEYLASPGSVLRRVACKPAKLHAMIDVVTIHSAPVGDVQVLNFPEALRLLDDDNGWKYDKIWGDEKCPWDLQCDGKVYEKWGVDRLAGAVVALRLDQYIG
ncbi:phenol hydroxylase [Aspergillus bertholletiae]|uniref:Phenol hydroxylase n=1 Tax=Aspergillus bertholletiae TaxID=1226010 RepID=A0A5N7B1Z9_9EURO|nr:phenol hydroxylase [Aspergillus bertholletiae]